MFHARALTPLAAIAGPLTAIAIAAAPAAEASAVSHAALWQNKPQSVVCGIKIHARRKPASTLLCSSIGIPRAKHGIGDPFVEITSHGAPTLILLSQNSFQSQGAPATLGKGTTWRAVGVSCQLAAKTVTCTNKSRHGFTIGNGKYRGF